jgi:hypothetical protein
MSLEIKTLVCLSTAHIDQDTARELDCLIRFPLPTAARDVPAIWQAGIVAERWQVYGWFVWVPSPSREAMPRSLRACLGLAEADGATWIQFDRDCEPIGDLPTYDW